MTRSPNCLVVSAENVGPAYLLVVRGVLDSGTYLELRDTVIKAAVDRPAAVLVEVTNLTVPAQSAWSVFTSARWHITTWPDVPIMLVCERPEQIATIARNGITRYVPVYSSVHAALRSVAGVDAQPRRRASTELPPALASLRQARQLVAEWLSEWSHDELIPVAKVVVDVLVGNVLQHTDSAPVLRVESAGQAVTIAVRDDSAVLAVRHEIPGQGTSRVSGLAVVTALSRTWGVTPTSDGKTVWAVIGPENRL